ncbi:MAG: carbohydrate-binding protein [Tepidisphaeraceae bacterium]
MLSKNGSRTKSRAVAQAVRAAVSSWVESLEARRLFAQSPWTAPFVPPVTIQAEEYDKGGEAEAYHDANATNILGSFRATEGPDVESTGDAGGGLSLGCVEPGEWLEYTVNIPAAGSYTFEARVAASGAGGTFHVEFGGVDKTGAMSVPDTGGWQTYTTVGKTVSLAAGQQVMRVSFDGQGANYWVGNVNWFRLASSSVPVVSVVQNDSGVSELGPASGFTVSRTGGTAGPLTVNYSISGTATNGVDYATLNGTLTIPVGAASAVIPVTPINDALFEGTESVIVTLIANPGAYAIGSPPGAPLGIVDDENVSPQQPWTSVFNVPTTIEAEHFDKGGEGIAFHDNEATNFGGAFRTTEGVDIQATGDAGGGQNVGWVAPGEWLEYTVNVGQAGAYNFEARVASFGAGGTFHVEFAGVDKTGAMSVGSTGAWQSYSTLAKNGLALDAGVQVMRVSFDTGGPNWWVGNFNWFRLTGTSLPTVTVVAAPAGTGEGSVTPAAFVATRTSTSGVLSVPFTVAGSAGAGDYTLGATQFFFPAGTASVSVNVFPTDDGLFEGDETVVLTLGTSASGDYNVGTPSGATVTIADNDAPSQQPFTTPFIPPVTIQVEEYDRGGAGIAFNDTDAANILGGNFRPGDAVDVEATADVGGGWGVGCVAPGEWLEYTLDVPQAGLYDVQFRVASFGAGGTFRAEFNGADKTGNVAVPNTGGWQNWTTITRTVNLAAGPQVMRLAFVGAGPSYWIGNFNWVRIVRTSSGGNNSPAAPVITEPPVDGYVVSAEDLHMETLVFADPDATDAHAATDWEVWTTGATPVRVWSALNKTFGADKIHIHFGDGAFEGPLAGQIRLNFDTPYQLRVRHKDSSGDAATEWSQHSVRNFRTDVQVQPVPNAPDWVADQAGYKVEVVPLQLAAGEEDWRLPVNIAFVPNPGEHPDDPFFYVTELYGTIRVVTRDLTVRAYATNLLNYNPAGPISGSGEQGLSGIVVDPATGDVFATMLYDDLTDGTSATFPKITRFTSTDGGLTAATTTDVLKMPGEPQGQSHFISNISFGPDGKLYVHNGDGFIASTALNLQSFRGKILRMDPDGSAPSDNPFYDPDDRGNDGRADSEDYVFAHGLRNPFGGAWRPSDGQHYSVENGPSLNDRFAKITRGTSYGWNGSEQTMTTNAVYNWHNPVAPVNIAFVDPTIFGGSGFPQDKWDHAFVSESGPTYGFGPQLRGKRISEFVLDANGNRVSGPTSLIHYTGDGRATVAGLAAGPDGLYFTDLYEDDSVQPTSRGAQILRVVYVGT